MVEKIAAGNSEFFIPYIRIIDTEGVCFVDAILLAYQEVVIVSTKITTATTLRSSASTTTLWSSTTTATSLIIAGCDTKKILLRKILLIGIIEISNNRYTPVLV